VRDTHEAAINYSPGHVPGCAFIMKQARKGGGR
jgi:hypothetical protein